MPVTTTSLDVLVDVSVSVAASAGAATIRTARLVELTSRRLPNVIGSLPAWAARFGGPPLSPFPYQSRKDSLPKRTNPAKCSEAVMYFVTNASPKSHHLRTNHLLVCKWSGGVAEIARTGDGAVPSPAAF